MIPAETRARAERPPSRLDSLRNLRARIDQEIDRELRYQRRIAVLSGHAKAIATTPGGFDERLIAVAAAHFRVHPDEITGNSRVPAITNARHVCAWLMRGMGRSFPDVGKALKKDHTTVMYGVKRVEASDELIAHAVVIREALTGEAA